MKKNKLIATFMIFLVLTLPVFSSAQSITLEKYSGTNNINGIVKDGDTLTVEVIAKRADGGAVSNDNVWLASKKSDGSYFGEYRFNSCSQLTDGNNKCIYSENDPLPDDYRVELRNENDELLKATEAFTLIVDDKEPSTELDYSFTSDGKLQVDYTTTDGEKCSGIQKIEFYIKTGTTKSSSKTIPGEKGQCTLEGSFETNVPTTQLVQGQLCAKATDYFGQSSQPDDCIDFVYDKKAPTIKNAKLMSEDGVFELTHLKSASDVSAQLVVEVDGDKNSEGISDVKEVVADLSNLGGDVEQSLTKINEKEFSTDFTITKTDACTYSVKAVDKNGNKATDKSFTCTLPIDRTSPTVSSISTSPEVLGKEGKITVVFSDLDDDGNEGVGISEGEVKITVEDIRFNNKNPDKCVNSNSGEWSCDWSVTIPAGVQSGDKIITVNGADNLGNRLEEYTSKIKIDLDVPEELSAAYEVVGGVTQAIPYPIIGDTIKFTLKGKDVNSAEADFSSLKGSKESVLCDKEKCVFTQDVKKGTKIGDNKITFTAIDKAGNSKKIDLTVKIYDTVNGKPKPNGYWDVGKVNCMPSKIDRTTVAQFGEYPVYCQIELQSLDLNAEVASVTVKQKDCTGEFASNNIKSLEVIQNSNTPYLSFILEPKEFASSTETISCPLTIYTLKNNKLDKNPEKETVEAKLNFYRDSLGDVYSETDKKIKDAIKKTKWDSEVISKLKDLLDLFEKICQLKSVFVGLIAVWNFFHFTWVGAETFAAADPTGTTKVLTRAERVSACLAKESSQDLYANTWVKYLDPFCSALSCRSAAGAEGTNWGSFIGGNYNTWCADLDKFLNVPEFKEATGQVQQIKNEGVTGQKENIQVLSVKDSIVWSTLCLCPAGIVRNLDKAKQIDCRYATCLIEDVKERGLPIEECKQMKSEMKCAYVFGEIWNAIPYTQLFDKFVNVISQMFTDPVKLLSIALGVNCKANCLLEPPTASTFCGGVSLASAMGEAYSSISDASKQKGIWSKDVKNDYCAKLDTLKKPYE